MVLSQPIRKTVAGTDTLSNNSINQHIISGLTKPVSVIGLGFEFFPDFATVSPVLDAYYETGGNVFDTAYIYGDGATETIFGDWLHSRQIPREEIVLIGKGIHSPDCYPEMIAKQLTRSLERLQTDYVDVYFMHRDNPEVPVDEFIDAVDAEVKSGRIRGIFGGSNWSRERMDKAIVYAKANDRAVPSVLSNNFSLAEMVEPVWPGCVAATGQVWEDWLTEKQVPNFAWSSQARGFFTDRAIADNFDDKDLVRCWYSEKNFERRKRAEKLAQNCQCSVLHIALAYVVAQPFPVIPLIGPHTIAELEDSLLALKINLTAKQREWLRS